ncbi:MAG: VOC family protein [Chitinophagaceae bacterium]|nr:VOC family protein [Chitinophagaceae bacterium]
MLTAIHPKLPMRNKEVTRQYYIRQLGFEEIGPNDFPEYLMIKKDQIELHFFLSPKLDPFNHDGQVYIRTNNIQALYQSLLEQQVPIHPNGSLQQKPWGQIEFSLLDPDHNLLTFGQSIF